MCLIAGLIPRTFLVIQKKKVITRNFHLENHEKIENRLKKVYVLALLP